MSHRGFHKSNMSSETLNLKPENPKPPPARRAAGVRFLPLLAFLPFTARDLTKESAGRESTMAASTQSSSTNRNMVVGPEGLRVRVTEKVEAVLRQCTPAQTSRVGTTAMRADAARYVDGETVPYRLLQSVCKALRDVPARAVDAGGSGDSSGTGPWLQDLLRGAGGRAI